MDKKASAFFDNYPSTKLNLGCGTDVRDGFTNIDMHDYGLSNTIVGDVMNLQFLPRCSFTEIVAWDILEHIKHRETLSALFEWNGLLARGGLLNIRTTFINGLVRIMERDEWQSIQSQQILITNLFSRQLVDGDYHLNAFTEPMIRFYLWATGFSIKNISIKDEWIWDVWAQKSYDLCDDDTLLSYGKDDEFVERSYMSILNRPADISGMKNYCSMLKKGMTRQAVVKSLWTSDEHQNMLRDIAPLFKIEFPMH